MYTDKYRGGGCVYPLAFSTLTGTLPRSVRALMSFALVSNHAHGCMKRTCICVRVDVYKYF